MTPLRKQSTRPYSRQTVEMDSVPGAGGVRSSGALRRVIGSLLRQGRLGLHSRDTANKFAESGEKALASPLEHLPHVAGQALADDKLLGVGKRQQPPLAAEGRHFADVVDVDQRAAVDALKNRTAQALVDGTERLSGHVALAGGDDPDDFALGLEGQHVIEIEQEVLLARAADYLAAAGGGRRLGNFAEASQRLGDIAWPGAEDAGAVEGLFQAFPADRFEQVIQSAGFEGTDGVLVVGGDNDDDRLDAGGQTANDVESAHAGHLQIQKDEMRD